jgi:CBS domain-containing protein
MTDCPNCGHANIEGVDECDACGLSLVELTKPQASSSLEQAISKDVIERLHPRDPLVVESQAPVAMVIKLLYDHRVGCAIVVDDGQIVGIFSERDALMRLGPDLETRGDRPIAEFMTPNPETLRRNDRIAFALRQMDQGGYRHMPIVDDDDRIGGVISVRDVLRYVTEHLAG